MSVADILRSVQRMWGGDICPGRVNKVDVYSTLSGIKEQMRWNCPKVYALVRNYDGLAMKEFRRADRT